MQRSNTVFIASNKQTTTSPITVALVTALQALRINGKMSEFNAALGLLQLKHMPAVLARRAQIDALYRERLGHIDGVEALNWPDQDQVNGSYFPIRILKWPPLGLKCCRWRLKSSPLLLR
jgi:dTDP-4-amino-4,6-dideoxygalactose transaminase